MSTPKETAVELVDKMYSARVIDFLAAKQCALIACREIWKGIDANFHAHPDKPSLSENTWNRLREYYDEVESEIDKL